MFPRISHLLAVLTFLLFFASLTSAQPPSPAECPAIDVEVPSHELAPSEEARFTLRITPKKPEWKFRYKWFLSEGQPLTGQDTDTITVKRGKAPFIDATVQISGGPDDSMCPVVSTDRATWAPIEGEEAECPSIQIQGPAGVPMPGQLIKYTAMVTHNGARYEPRFNWSISAGEIVSGQGTDRVVIRPPRSSLTVTVDLLGLPDECRVSASESNSGPEPHPQAIKIVQFRGVGTLELDQLKRFTEELKNNPNNQGYILVGHRAGTTQPQMYAREQSIRNAVRNADPDHYDDTRITITAVGRSADVAEFWRVPPGANNPACEACESVLACPKLSVAGPAGRLSNGMAIFSINADLPNLEKLGYEWKVTAGKIDQGQGKPYLYVTTDAGKTLKATVRVMGLPKDCPDTASFEAGEVESPGHLVMFDEYDDSLTAKGELERLDLVAAQWKIDPTYYFYFIIYLDPKDAHASGQRRAKRIKDHLTLKRRMPSDKVVIVNAGVGATRSTHVYRVTPDARKNFPAN